MLPAPIADSALVTPSPGLMIWTLVIFFITMYLLKRLAFGRIAEYIDERRTAVRDNLESAERSRVEAQELFEEYKAQLAEARTEASQIVERSRQDERGARPPDARGGESAARARPCGSTRGDPGRDAPGARSDQERGRRAHGARDREGGRPQPRRGGAAAPDRGSARGRRLLEARRRGRTSPWLATPPATSTARPSLRPRRNPAA